MIVTLCELMFLTSHENFRHFRILTSRRHSGLMADMLEFKSSGPGASPG